MGVLELFLGTEQAKNGVKGHWHRLCIYAQTNISSVNLAPGGIIQIFFIRIAPDGIPEAWNSIRRAIAFGGMVLEVP